MKSVDFYFDFLSPFAYLASETIEAVCERHGASVTFQPVLFAGLLNHWGQRGPAEIAPKALHTLKHCARQARLQGIALRAPQYHPFRPLTALRACLTQPAQQRPALVHALFRFGWARGGDLGDDQAIAAALTDAGFEGSAIVARTKEPALKQQLAQNTARAIARGVFGVPSMWVDDELFWGIDQLHFLDLYLQGRDPLADIDLEALMPRGIGAWRSTVPPRQ